MQKAKKQACDWPTSFQCVDIAPIAIHPISQVLLGRRPKKKLWRFLGGFVDPTDASLEEAANREFDEEGNDNTKGDLKWSPPVYAFSARVDDPRYKDSNDKILTAVFVTYPHEGTPKGGDDIAEVKWFNTENLKINYKKILAKEHHLIFEKLIKNGWI